ncbi:hypothetical protein NB689_000922 [Xanthomonas sacchari]|nr:hypothetical protein [Xanthomonas sacchari]
MPMRLSARSCTLANAAAHPRIAPRQNLLTERLSGTLVKTAEPCCSSGFSRDEALP